MWNTVAAWLAVSVPPSATATSGNSNLQTAVLSFGGAVVGAVALIYTSRFKRDKPTGPAGPPPPPPRSTTVPTLDSPVTLQGLSDELGELQDYFRKRRSEIDDRLDNLDRQFDRNGHRIDGLEDWTDRADNRRRRANDDDPPDDAARR